MTVKTASRKEGGVSAVRLRKALQQGKTKTLGVATFKRRLSHWLRGWIEPPRRGIVGCDGPLTERAATELFTANRRKLLEEGAPLLSTRPLGTYVSGGGVSTPVVHGDEGLWFPSIREAARHYGVSAGTVVRWVQSQRGGWRRA